MSRSSNIRTAYVPDPPLVQPAGYEFNSNERQFVDEQIQALQLVITQGLLGGLTATWPIIDASSPNLAAGDVVISASTIPNAITKALTGTPLTEAGVVLGIALVGGAPQTRIPVALEGLVPSTITGLASGRPGPVRLNPATGRCQQVASFGSTDYPIGYVDNDGQLTVRPIPTGIAGAAGGVSAQQVQQQIAASTWYLTSNWVQGSDISHASTTIASGSNGATLATATTINLVSTAGMLNSGSVMVTSSTGTWKVQYLGISGNSITGCLTFGTGTLSTGGAVTQSALSIPGPWNRLFASTAVQFGTIGGRVILESIQQMSAALQTLGITGGSTGIPNVNMYYWPEVQVTWAWPSTTGYYGAHCFVEGPGAAGIIESYSPNGNLVGRWLLGAQHGTIEISNFVFTGDPNAPKIDGAFLIPQDHAFMVSVQGNTWNTQLKDLEFYSFSCTQFVLGVSGLTGPNIYERLHFSGCNTAAATSPPYTIGASGVFYWIGAENGHHLNGGTWLTRQLPLYQLPSKAWGYSPGIYIDEGEAPGTNTGTGNTIEHAWMGDTLGCAVEVNPSVGGGIAGMLSMAHCYFAANTSNALFVGTIVLDHNVLSFKMERCTDFRNNQASFPLLGFNGTGIGPVKVDQNQTAMWASSTVMPAMTATNRPSSLVEIFGPSELEVDYYFDSGSGTTAGLCQVIAGAASGFPTFKTATTSSQAQDVTAVAVANAASGGVGAYARWGQPHITVTNDGNAALSASNQIEPSPSVAGAVRLSSAQINTIGQMESAAGTSSTGTARLM